MSDIKRIMETVRDFLFSKSNKEFLTFLFFLAFAAGFWIMITLNETYEQEVVIEVKYANVPKNVVMTSDDTDTVRVTLSDKGLTLIRYMEGKTIDAIKVDYSKYATGIESGFVPESELQQMIAEKLMASTRIVSITPRELEFFYNFGASKRVPVRWEGNVKPQHPHFIASETIEPDSVDIYASQRLLDSISIVYTEPLNINNICDTLRQTAQLQRIRGVKTIPGSVNITFTTDILTEEAIENIPIRGINVPEGKVLRTFPSKVKVNFVTGIHRLRSLKASDFEVIADYNEIVNNPSSRCQLRLTKVPEGVSRASLTISETDYLIEE